MRLALAILVPALVLAPAAHADEGVRHDQGIGFYVGVDGRATFPTGIYAGQANPNFNRLTYLFDHGDHFHGIGAYSLTGDPPGTILDTNSNNRIPETYTGLPPTQLAPGTGAWSGTWRTSLAGDAEYRFLGIASIQSLAGYPAGSAESILYSSSGARWNASFENVLVGLQLVSISPGLHVGSETQMDIFGGGDTYALGDSGSLEFMPVFWTGAGAAAGTYSAELRLVNLGANTAVLDGGRFYVDFAVPVPEPQTYLLLIAGLVLVATIARKRMHDV
jgi:hypothetical protein